MSSFNKISNFPADRVPESERLSDAYGAKVAKAIYSRFEYYNSTLREKISENRAYARGLQDVNQYKTILDPDWDKGNTTLVNIDWSITSPLPKLVNTVLGGMINQDQKIQVNAVDRNSNVIRNNKRDELFGEIIKNRYLKALEQEAGIQVTNQNGFVPENEEEVDMYMQMEFKTPVEMASEEIIDWELYNNDWEKIKRRVLRDGIENAQFCVRTYFDSNYKIRVRYVDIFNYTESESNDPYSDDSDYQAELVYYSIRDIRKLSNSNVTEEDLFYIAKTFSGERKGNSNWEFGNTYHESGMYNNVRYNYDDFRIACLDFVYYTVENNVWIKKSNKYGGTYFNKKKPNYKSPKKSKNEMERYDKEMEVSYEGLWVVGYDKKMIRYHKTKNMLRKVENGKISPKIKRPFLYVQPTRYNNTSMSIVDLCRPIIDDLQNLTYKMRHFISEAAPMGLRIDVEGINNIFLNDNKVSAHDIIKMFKQKGIALYRGIDENGDPTRTAPVDTLPNGLGNGLAPFQSQYAFKLEELRNVSGINKARDASEPDKKALVGIQKLALMNSNNSTRELYDSFLDGIFRRLGDNISIMANYKIQFKDGLDYYSNVIGEFGAKLLKLTAKDFSKSELGMKVEALPTDEEQQILNNDINISLAQKEIRLEDAMAIRRIMNLKKAEKLLIYKREKYAKESMQKSAQLEEMTMQREKAATMASAEKEIAISRANAELEMAKMEKEHQLKIMLNDHETMNKIRLIDREGLNKKMLIEEAQDEAPEEGGSDTGSTTNTDGGSTVAGNSAVVGEESTKADDLPRIFSNPAGSAVRTDK